MLILPMLLLSVMIPPAAAAQPRLIFQKTWAPAIPLDVAVDSSGNSYVTGFTGISDPFLDVFLLKYDSSGSLDWARNWGGNRGDEGWGVAADASGNIYVTGTTSIIPVGSTLFLLKFNSAGSLLWQSTLSGVNSGYDVAVDPSNDSNIYVTGDFYNSSSGGGFDAILLKFESSGNLLWQRTWGDNATDYQGTGVAIDASGSIYVTGPGSTAEHSNLFLVKFNSTGSLLWWEALSGILQSGVTAGYSPRLALDSSSSSVYVSGSVSRSGSDDALLMKANSSGSLLWQRTWGGPNDDFASDVATDASGNVLESGGTSSAGTLGNCTWGGEVFYTCHDAVLLKFNSAGSLISQSTWGAVGDDYGTGIAVDGNGDPVITGFVSEAGPYTLGSAGFALRTPAFTPLQLNYTPGMPNFTPAISAGTVGTLSGNETNGGVFLLKFGSPTSTFPAISALLTALVTSAIVALKRHGTFKR